MGMVFRVGEGFVGEMGSKSITRIVSVGTSFYISADSADHWWMKKVVSM